MGQRRTKGGSGLRLKRVLGVLAAGVIAGMLATSGSSAAFSAGATFKVATYSSAVSVDASGRGWLGLAFSRSGLLYGIASDGYLYAASATGAAPVTMNRIGTLPVAPGASGLAFGLDGKLYVATAAGVREIKPTDATTLRTIAVATGVPDGLAVDPVSGDLFLTTNFFIYWIANPASSTATAAFYTGIPTGGRTASHGISINLDGTIYAATSDHIWRITNPHAMPAGVLPTPEPISDGVGLKGVAVVTNNVDTVPRFVFANSIDGSMTRYPEQLASGAPVPVVSGAERGDFMTIGPDHCVYAAQGSVVVRISHDDGSALGTCDLSAATTPSAVMTLTATGGSPPRVGAEQTFEASVTPAGTLADGTLITFEVNRQGKNPQIVTVAAISGHAILGYAATTPGIDVIIATGLGLTSNEVTVDWGPAFDPIPPVITYTVAGTQGLNFQCIVATGVNSTDSCGYYITPPTVTWTVTKGGTAEVDLIKTNHCSPFTLTASTGPAGIPVTCQAYNTDGAQSSKTVFLQVLLTPPTIAAVLTTADGGSYAGGPTSQNVIATFTCADDAGLGAILSCSLPVTVATEGAGQTVTGTVADAAGRVLSVPFGPIFIDLTPPTLSVTATLPGGASYGYGNWTNQDVRLTYSCADSAGLAPSGIKSCPGSVTVSATRAAFSATATDIAGNSTTVNVGAINIDKTPPTISATATAGGVRYDGTVPTNKTVVVTFTCTTNGALVTFCPPAQSFSTGGTFTVTGTATNEFGRTTTASFGPFTIDVTKPTVSVRATIGTGSDAPDYGPGTWTNRDVTLTYICSDASGMQSCPPQATVSSTQAAFTNSATDTAGNVGTVLVPAISIDKTPPTITVTATAGGVAYNGASPTNKTVVVMFSCVADGAPMTSCSPTSQTFTAVGTYTASASATDSAGNTATASFGPFLIVSTLDSTLRITSPAVLMQGATTVTALLLGPAGAVAGKTVTFTAGASTVSGVTIAGVATATLTLAPGQYSLTASFAGDAQYFASAAGPQTILVAGATQFVIWGGNATGVQLGQRVIFWGEHWADQVDLAKRSKVKDLVGDFKGWAATVSGTGWSTKPGNSKPPEAIPTYISVIITTSLDRASGEDKSKGDDRRITGNIVGHAILQVDSAYKNEPGKPVYGVVVAVLP